MPLWLSEDPHWRMDECIALKMWFALSPLASPFLTIGPAETRQAKATSASREGEFRCIMTAPLLERRKLQSTDSKSVQARIYLEHRANDDDEETSPSKLTLTTSLRGRAKARRELSGSMFTMSELGSRLRVLDAIEERPYRDGSSAPSDKMAGGYWLARVMCVAYAQYECVKTCSGRSPFAFVKKCSW